MKILVNNNIIGEVITNRSMTIEEAMYYHGYDLNDQEDLKRGYEEDIEGFYYNPKHDLKLLTTRKGNKYFNIMSLLCNNGNELKAVSLRTINNATTVIKNKGVIKINKNKIRSIQIQNAKTRKELNLFWNDLINEMFEKNRSDLKCSIQHQSKNMKKSTK